MIKALAILTYVANLENLHINSFNEIFKGTFRNLKGKLLFKFWVSHTLAPHLELSIQSWVLKCKYISTYSKCTSGWILGENKFVLTQRTRWDKIPIIYSLLYYHGCEIFCWIFLTLILYCIDRMSCITQENLNSSRKVLYEVIKTFAW